MSFRGGRSTVTMRGKNPAGHFQEFRYDVTSTSNRSRSIRRVPRNFQNRLVDEDVPMDGGVNPPRSNFRGGGNRGRGGFRGRNRQGGGRNFNRRSDAGGHNFGPGWHKVLITNGASYDRDFILNSIASLTREPFQPIAYSRLGVNATFFVESRAAAEGVAACSGRFSGPDAQPIILKVDTYGAPPTATLDANVEGLMKTALEKRYDASAHGLALHNFANSPEFVTNYYIPLFRPTVVTKIFSLLRDILPTLVILDISSNKLATLESFQKLSQLTPNLKALNLSNNKLREIYLLERIKGLPILEVVLEKNPLVERFENKDEFIRVLRKYFPKVVKVDGIDAPPPVTFDLEEEKSIIPPIKPGYSCNEEARRVVNTFIEQYFKIYDADVREPLLDAYHEGAVFTVQSSYLRPGNTEAPSARLSAYLTEARNFAKNQDVNRLERCFHSGKLDIVAFLSRLPKTKHDITGFTVDLTLAIATLINFSVTGCFKERGGPREMSLRYFHRTFLLMPLNQGFVIINEMLFVTNATSDQNKVAFSIPTQTPTPSPSSDLPAGELPNIPSLTITSNTDARAMMIKQFAKESTMNEAWASKCLEQNEWNYEKSALVFTELHKSGGIPAEAFVK